MILMNERQISFSDKTHALENNDNFSFDGRFLCYDTRGTVYNETIGNCKTIEKIEISTGIETILWEPASITGEQAAPGVGAVSWHPSENKVIFIHGSFIDGVQERGYYDIRNRTGVEIRADGKGNLTKVDMRDVSAEHPTTPGAQRGGTHRHEYSRNGKRIGFTYDDFLQQNYGRTIGYMEASKQAPPGYTHYFAVLLKPAEKGKSKPGEIEKAYGDSWVDSEGKMRAFIGEVRAANGVDYDTALFVAEIPDTVDITSGFPGDKNIYPVPPKGIHIRQLTHRGCGGIVRGSPDGKRIAYLSKDQSGVKQVFVIPVDGSDQAPNPDKQPKQLTHLDSDASFFRWHSANEWVFAISNGNILATYAGDHERFGKTIWLTNNEKKREELVVLPDGDLLAYSIIIPDEKLQKEEIKCEYRQLFVMELNWGKINQMPE